MPGTLVGIGDIGKKAVSALSILGHLDRVWYVFI